jgi:anti-sigma factor RsiW
MDYWLADLPPAAEEAVEEHLLTCDACGDRLREVIDLSESLRGWRDPDRCKWSSAIGS